MSPVGERLSAVKVAFELTLTQQWLLASNAGAARFVFNRMLAEVKVAVSAQAWVTRLRGAPVTHTQGWSLPALRRGFNTNNDQGAPGWHEVCNEAFNHALASLGDTLDDGEKSRKGTSKGPATGFPKSRGRRARRSLACTTCGFGPNSEHIRAQLPRIGRVNIHEQRDSLVDALDPGQVLATRSTVSHARGRWWCAFPVTDTRRVTVPVPRLEVVGVDAGVFDLLFAVTPDGTQVLSVPAPEPLTAGQDTLRAMQRRAVRQTCDSGRWRTMLRRIGKVHIRLANLRADAIHMADTKRAPIADTVGGGDLTVRSMAAREPDVGRADPGLDHAVADAVLAEVSRQFRYETRRHGTQLIETNGWHPSSKTCSLCGRRNPNLPLDLREWACVGCGVTYDRDINAAPNLAQLAVCTSCREWPGGADYGRGTNRKPCPAQTGKAGGCEAPTKNRPHRQSGQARTAGRHLVAA